MILVSSLRITAVTIASVLLAACGSEPTCDYSDAPYMSAQTIPSLRAPEGLSTPDHSGALVVPPAPANAAPAPTGKGRCLDRPPSYFSTTPRPVESTPEKK